MWFPLVFSGAITSTQYTDNNRHGNFNLVSSDDEDSDDEQSTEYPANSSPIFNVNCKPTSTISRPPATPPSSPQPSTSGEQQKKCLKKNLVDYSDSLDDDCEIVDITGVLSDSELHFKTPVSDVELQNLGGKTFAASTDKKISWAKKLFDDWKCARNEYNERGSI